MRRYHLEVIVRPDPERYILSDPDGTPERVVNAAVTSGSEEDARRRCIDRAHYNGMLVSRFLSVRSRSLKD